MAGSTQQQQVLPQICGVTLWLSLPLEVLELICSSLPTPDRYCWRARCISSCCLQA